MKRGTPSIVSLIRAMDMLEAIIQDEGRSSLSAIARKIQIPTATAHRQVKSLQKAGFLTSIRNGKYVIGPRMIKCIKSLTLIDVIKMVAIPILSELAGKLDCIVHLGTLDDDMITYLVKEGSNSDGLFTKRGMQLEAYCSAMGKVLLADLPEKNRELYISSGPFPALTEKTITSGEDLRAQLRTVRSQGYAIDDGEIVGDLRCIAVGIRLPGEPACAAISVSRTSSASLTDHEISTALNKLRISADLILDLVSQYTCPS
ncbi:IclR family transcriptional regulator [Novosphingobium sp.]|uniref:IclR family transcriptional regulator n=1 Tax=Novosphingobium sp. TaxID=1874826 RepID=UPI002629B183|nr:IclR family transcriptional regulator [Novosphingobium sp.]